MNMATDSNLRDLMTKHQFPWWGTATLTTPHTFEIYRQWLQAGKHGEMTYLTLHLPQKQVPQTLLPKARSSLVVAVNYKPHPAPHPDWPLKQLPIAAYAKGLDYHFWLRSQLDALIADLQKLYPNDVFLGMSDSHPVLERDLAQRAGLGWFGKNTCLIHPRRGSFFLLGEIYTSLDLTAFVEPQSDHCGSCRRCIEACPTSAITEPKVLDARLCISYWTIESREVPPEPLRKKIGEWFFGCDICQQVCPWNEKVLGQKFKPRTYSDESREELLNDLRLILNSSNKKLSRIFLGSPLTRAGGRGLKRNAILVAAHYECYELSAEIHQAGQDHPELLELSQWAIEAFSSLSTDRSSAPPDS
ncbi:MAG: tRNA epoxyqueuosine(34) reductase QueG [Bdellovibrionales bacterium]